MKRAFLMIMLVMLVLGLNAQTKKVVLLEVDKTDSGASTVQSALNKNDLQAMFTQSGQYTLADAKEVAKAVKQSGRKPSELGKDEMIKLGNQFQADLVLRGTLSSVSNTQFKLVVQAVSTKTSDMKRFTVDLPINSGERMDVLKRDLLTKINDMTGGELDRLFGVCERDFASSNFDAAETGLVQYIAIDPNRAQAYYLLGKIRVQKKRYDEAISNFNAGLKIQPTNVAMLSELADACVANGMRDEAVNALERMADLNPEDSAPWIRIAAIYKDAGDPDKTLEALRGAVQKSPNNARLRLILANQLYEAQLFDDALPEYERCAEAMPSDETIEKRLGTCYEKTGKYSDAITRYSNTLQANPSDKKTLQKRAGVYLQAARNSRTPEDALRLSELSVADYMTLIAGDASNSNLMLAMSESHLFAATAAERMKDATKEKAHKDAGIKAIQDALRIAPDNANVHLKLASLYYDQGKMADAQKSAETAIQKDPALITAYLLLSRVTQNYGIDRYNRYVELDNQYQNGSEVGSKKDALRNTRNATKSEAHSQFAKAADYLETAKTKTTDPDELQTIQRMRETLNQYLKNTEQDFFDK